MSVLTCNNIKTDGVTLAWVDGVLTNVVDGVPVVPKSQATSPCGGFQYNDEVFRAEKHVLTLIDKVGVPVDHFTICGGVAFDKDVFEFKDSILSVIPQTPDEGSSGEDATE